MKIYTDNAVLFETMTAFWALAVVLVAGAASASSIPNRIVGGEPTTVERYPSIVQVDYLGLFSDTWGQSCAASILTRYYVLSAAHCFEGFFYDPTFRRVRVGTTYRNTGGTIVNVVREFNHPSYGHVPMDGDVTVVLLARPLVYSPVVQQGIIISQGSEIPDNMPVVYAGWGTTSEGGSPSSVLQDVTVFTVNRGVCQQRYFSTLITQNMICAGILDVGGKDACQGDSGGPLYYGDIIVGVVSWGRGCADSYFPGVSTKVSSYTNWIVATVSQ